MWADWGRTVISSWIIFALLSALFAALVAIFGKIGISGVDSTLATAIRSIIMAALLVIVALGSGKFELVGNVDRKALTFIFLSGLAGAASWLFYFWALKNGPAGAVSAVDRLSLVFVVILAGMFLGEGWGWKTVAGVVLATAGAVLITWR